MKLYQLINVILSVKGMFVLAPLQDIEFFKKRTSAYLKLKKHVLDSTVMFVLYLIIDVTRITTATEFIDTMEFIDTSAKKHSDLFTEN